MTKSNEALLIHQGEDISEVSWSNDQCMIGDFIFYQMDKALNKLYSNIPNYEEYLEILEHGVDKDTEKTYTWSISDKDEEYELVYQKQTGEVYLKGDLSIKIINGCVYKDNSCS